MSHKNVLDLKGYDLEGVGEYCYVSYRPDSSSTWITENIIGDNNAAYITELNYTINLPDNDLYNDGSFEIKIGNSGPHANYDFCWFRMLEIYGCGSSAGSPTIQPTTEPTQEPTTEPTTEPTADSNNNSCDFDLAAYLSVLLQIYGDSECDCDNSQSVLPLFDNNDRNEFRDMYHDLMDEYKKNSNYMFVSVLMNCITILGLIAYICSRNKPRDQSIYASVKAVDSDYDDDK